MNDVEQKLIGNMRLYKTKPKEKYIGSSGRYTDWFDAIHSHFLHESMPNITKAGEVFIEYWPIFFIIDGSERGKIYNGSSYTEWRGVTATGYLCVTNKNMYFYLFRNLSDRFPLLKKDNIGSALLQGFFNNGAANQNLMKPIDSDTFPTFSYHSISQVDLISKYGQKVASIQTLKGSMELATIFRDHIYEIIAAIQLGKLGNFDLTTTKSAPLQNSQNYEELLKQLSNLRTAGIISEKEYEEKKQAILNRM